MVMNVVSAESRKSTALLRGKEISHLPEDLYIPPDALRIFLEMFEGPLDLLLHLIRKHDLDILDVSIARITDQYMRYIEMMTLMRLQLAGDYLVMAATLAELKSRLLLPKPHKDEDDEEEDPRVELVKRLKEYEQIKIAATKLDEIPRMDRDLFATRVFVEARESDLPPPKVSMSDLVFAFAAVIQRSQLYQVHDVTLEPISVRMQKNMILDTLRQGSEFADFFTLVDVSQGTRVIVYSFLAMLVLLQERSIEVIQNSSDSKIYVKLADDV